MLEVLRYVTADGKDILGEWMSSLANKQARAKIATRILRLGAGNFGDCKPVGSGDSELRINWGPGYRVYYAMKDRGCVILLCGGDKRKQAADIHRAIRFWEDYRNREKQNHEIKS